MVCKTKDEAPIKPPKAATRGVLCLVLTYALVAGTWVVLSDWRLALDAGQPFQFARWHFANGLLFVGVTTILLYTMLSRLTKAQAARNEKFHSIIEQARDGIVLCDQALRIVYANPATQKISGYTAEELIGHPIADLLSEQYAALLDGHAEALEQHPFIRREWDIRHKSGWRVHIEVNTQRLPDGSYLAIGSDLTETRRAQKKAEEERQRLQALVRAIPDPVWLTDTSGVYIACNPALEKLFKLPAEQILYRTDSDIRLAGDIGEFLPSDLPAGSTAAPLTFSQSYRHPNGAISHFETTRSPVFDSHDELIGVVGIARDVTAQKMAEDVLRASEEFSRAVLDASAAQMAVVDKSGTIVGINDAWSRCVCENTCMPADEGKTGVGSNFFKGCRHRRGSNAEQAQAARAGVQAVLDGETARFSMEISCLTPSRELWFMMNATPLKLGAGGAVITYMDITSVKDAQSLQSRFTRQLQALARMHQDIQEKERHHLSLELHDQIGQALAALKISLVGAKLHLDDPLSTSATLEAAQAIVDEIAQTTGDIARRLRPPLLDELGVRSALAWHIRNLSLPPEVDVQFEQNIDTLRFSEAVELACFRIVQEAITNALRHAEPTTIIVRIACLPDQICLSVEDDGKGFEIDMPLDEDDERISLGLIGIRERVTSLGGEFKIDSQPNTGTKVSACLPKTART